MLLRRCDAFEAFEGSSQIILLICYYHDHVALWPSSTKENIVSCMHVYSSVWIDILWIWSRKHIVYTATIVCVRLRAFREIHTWAIKGIGSRLVIIQFLYVSLSFGLTLCLCLCPVYLPLPISLCLSLSLSTSLSLCLYLSICLCLPVSIYLGLCLSVAVCLLSLSVSLQQGCVEVV